MKEKIGIIILAAGASTRLGSPKQLLKYSGETLLERVVNSALETGFETLVVTGSEAQRVGAVIDYRSVEVIRNSNWETGMASSIRAGLKRSLEKTPELDAVILVLCDQPFVTCETLEKLARVYLESRKSIVASAYDDTLGTPALFSRKLFRELEDLEGDTGAKPIIKRNPSRETAAILVPEAAFDIDSLKDYEMLLQTGTENL